MKLSRYLHDSLDALGIAACEYDACMRAVSWNDTFLLFFPEDEGEIFVGEAYRDNLHRFFRRRLAPEEMPEIERYVAEGVARHLNQTQPFEFVHHGLRLRASSLSATDGGRVRMWQRIDIESQPATPSELALPIIDALPFIPDGATILDAQDRIIAANEAFRQLYDLPAAGHIVGCTLDEIVAWCWRADSPGGAWRAAIRSGLRYDGAPFEIELPGQRWLRVIARHSADGVGFFTHADITSAKRQQMQLQEAQAALRQANAALAELAQTDGLTGLANRRRFVGALADAVALPQPLALMMIDVDHFKRINDRFGHLAGDACLRMIAQDILCKVVPDSGLVARLGGEEFAVLLEGVGADSAVEIASAIRYALAQADWHPVQAGFAGVTVSIGLCTGEGPIDGMALYGHADDALYVAKRNGRDRIETTALPVLTQRIAG